MPLRFDDSVPGVREVGIDGELSDDEFDQLVENMASLGSAEPFVLIVDLRKNHKVKIRHLKKMGSWINKNRAQMSEHLGTFVVVNNPFMRAAVNFISTIAPGAQRQYLVEELEEARRGAARVLQRTASTAS